MSSSPQTLCLGDALVDLIGERPGARLTEIDRFSPHFGGAAANVALVAAQAGAEVSLAGGAGEDGWGRWLRLLARLALSGFYPPSVAAGLPDAIEAAARACERWGAVD